MRTNKNDPLDDDADDADDDGNDNVDYFFLFTHMTAGLRYELPF